VPSSQTVRGFAGYGLEVELSGDEPGRRGETGPSAAGTTETGVEHERLSLKSLAARPFGQRELDVLEFGDRRARRAKVSLCSAVMSAMPTPDTSSRSMEARHQPNVASPG
jgi:hypothetical protein